MFTWKTFNPCWKHVHKNKTICIPPTWSEFNKVHHWKLKRTFGFRMGWQRHCHSSADIVELHNSHKFLAKVKNPGTCHNVFTISNIPPFDTWSIPCVSLTKKWNMGFGSTGRLLTPIQRPDGSLTQFFFFHRVFFSSISSCLKQRDIINGETSFWPNKGMCSVGETGERAAVRPQQWSWGRRTVRRQGLRPGLLP